MTAPGKPVGGTAHLDAVSDAAIAAARAWLDRAHPALRTLFFCIGAQKASTTWLALALAAHRDCHVPAVKEMSYWSRLSPRTGLPEPRARVGQRLRQSRWHVLRSLPRPAALRQALWRHRATREAFAVHHDPSPVAYLQRLMAGRRQAPVAGELTPDYAMLPAATLSAMAALHADTRFILIMRDPVARLWSGVMHALRDRADDPDRAFAAAIADPDSPHRRRGDYAAAIRALDAAVPPERVLYLFYETVRQPAELARIESFLGLRDVDWREERRVNVARGTGDGPGPEAAAAARMALAPIYDYVGERFGDAVPDAWGMR